jgi:NADPH:quinone reductase-like Zn-dependent oxidoreductase
MLAYEIRGAFGLENLVVSERPDPRPGPGEILLALRAAALNYRDLLTVEGKYNPRQKLPLVPCSDGVGEVVEVGPGVSRFEVGDRAVPLFAQRWLGGEPTRERLRSTLGGPLDGTLAQAMVVPAEAAVHPPEHLSDEGAACLPCAVLTAWSAVVVEGRVAAGDTVVVQGTGGVSLSALQVARLQGARVIVTSSSDEKLARARYLGAWETINYRSTPEWGRRVKELTDHRGADLVVEVGGAETLAQSLVAVRFGGTIALVGNLTGGTLSFNVVPAFMQRVRLQGILVGDRDAFEAMNRAAAANHLRPVIDRVFPWQEAREAFEHLASGKHFGKVCVGIAPAHKDRDDD